ncbi:hypothetical protein [Treponema socranskii]|uniref:hypothetical protein n=1 Tax=Treponema socranskii TaxID=53419 RepID=UPI0028F15DB7|nr:hypothetical protein [Treponema socranskii]
MGLLSRVSGGQSKKASGLLSRAAPRMQTPSYVSFSDLCRDFGILHGSLFEITDGSFAASACTGLDAQSIALSVSSPDFWNGTIGVDTSIKTFSNPLGNLAAFYQLFSPRIKERLSSVHFFRLSSDAVFMKADFIGENSSPPSETIKIALEEFIKNRGHGGRLKNGNAIFSGTSCFPNDNSALFFLLSTKIAINRTLVSVSSKSDAVKERLFNVICGEISDRLAHSFAAPNMCVQGKNGELHIVLFSHDDFDEAVLQFHISRFLSSFLSDAAASLMLIKVGSARSAEEIERFAVEG